jgi:mRNA interferase MazF
MPTSEFRQGDVVRVPFPYTDRDTRQHRPALVVSRGGVGEGESLLWVVMITSAENRPWPGDVSLGRLYGEAGLPAPSVIRPAKTATIEADHADRLGRIKPAMLAEVIDELRKHLGV